ncbi:subunit 17 of mediator complex-domain-containing protein [Mucor mucedo]|uniref:subunit 17 of mediator complex-domain-containing protein n=1 Tax=Mucor mucedo TaxID=29922 RepID=UPI00221F6C96|nr:subunit 17 of mediator complex-domain-containing protein [Mucor mucedo]KAI7896605.1 subunit 17 of mediator complex-domain-containing protein [Mucor mucedo]
MSEPIRKKLKLSLEPSIDNNVVDITNEGQEILKTETTLPEKLMQSVDRIWFERGEWKDITEKSLSQSLNSQEPTLVETDSDEEQDAPQSVQLPPAGYDIGKLRESVINKLSHAKSEIDVALDVINVLTAGNRHSTAAKDFVVPPGSLAATYVTKPKPTPKAQLESLQLNLGLKRQKQKQASDFLKRSAFSLKKIVEKEEVFWDEALDIRRNNWMMQANPQPGGSSISVQYGFTEVGSDFNEASVGELKRSGDNSNKLQMALPHSTARKVGVRVSQSHTGKLGLGQDAFSEGILGISTDAGNNQDDSTSCRSNTRTAHSDIQNQLAEAQSTVFDAELYSKVLAEAQALNSNVRFLDDEIVINIDGQIDLSVSKSLSSSNSKCSNGGSTQEIISRNIDASLRLLLLQHHKFNLWKDRAKILSSNHKIQQLLLLNESSNINHTANNAPTSANNNNPANNNITNNNGNVNNNLGNTVGTNNSVPVPNTNTSNIPFHRARVALTSHSQLTRVLPKEIPILLPIMSLTKFWVQFDRIRHVVHSMTSPFSGNGGLTISVHFKFHDPLLSKPSYSKLTYDAYPGNSEIALSLGISILKGPSLHFGFNQLGSISVCLPQTTVILQNVSEFEAFLSRELKVICLRTVCDVANDIIQRHESYIMATGSDKRRLLWKVNQVDEAVHGSICWYHTSWSHHEWRNINISLEITNVVKPSYSLQFRLCAMPNLVEEVYALNLATIDPSKIALNFKERARIVIQDIIYDSTAQKNP